MSNEAFLITGASDGIGAIYADRLAARGHDLVLVARRADRLATLAAELKAKHGIGVDILPADLSQSEGLATVEARLKEDERITGLVNNAGIAGDGPIIGLDPAHVTTMINLNILAVTRLTAAIAPRLEKAGRGTIINITSVTALMPAAFTAVYPATKAFVLAFTEALQAQLGPSGVRVQGVLPGITRTAIWEEEKLSTIPAAMVMSVDDMVDAALTGLDIGEVLTVPSLPDVADLERFLDARAALRPNLSHARAAARYGARRQI